jgi:hypothetical protein
MLEIRSVSAEGKPTRRFGAQPPRNLNRPPCEGRQTSKTSD